MWYTFFVCTKNRGIHMPHVTNKEKSKLNNIVPYIPDGDFYFTKGIEAFRNRKFDIALKWMKKAVEQKPNEPLYQCQMSIIYTEIGAYHAANQLLTNVLQSSDYIDCYYLIANNYAHLGLLNDAKKYANSYLDKEPDGDFSDDAKQLLELIEIDDEELDEFDLEDEDELLIYQETAFFHMEKMEWDKALPVIEKMIELFPNHELPKHDYTQALFFLDRKEEALQKELELFEENPNSLYSLTNLAIFYYELGQKEKSDAFIQAISNVYPIHEQQKLKLAVTLARTANFEESYLRFRSIAKGKVKNHSSYYRWYSIAAYHLGEPSKSLELWKEGCHIHPHLAKEKGPWDC
jgi:tetratricopeptide (TPR) repeat protein